MHKMEKSMNPDNSNSSNSHRSEEIPARGFLKNLLTHLRVSIVATIVLGVIVSGNYPVIVSGLAQA